MLCIINDITCHALSLIYEAVTTVSAFDIELEHAERLFRCLSAKRILKPLVLQNKTVTLCFGRYGKISAAALFLAWKSRWILLVANSFHILPLVQLTSAKQEKE